MFALSMDQETNARGKERKAEMGVKNPYKIGTIIIIVSYQKIAGYKKPARVSVVHETRTQ